MLLYCFRLWPLYPAVLSTREPKSNSWTCQVSLKVPKTEKDEDDKSLPLPELAAWSSLFWTCWNHFSTRKLSSASWKASEFVWTRHPQTSCSRGKKREESIFRPWCPNPNWIWTLWSPSWASTRSTTPTLPWGKIRHWNALTYRWHLFSYLPSGTTPLPTT